MLNKFPEKLTLLEKITVFHKVIYEKKINGKLTNIRTWENGNGSQQ